MRLAALAALALALLLSSGCAVPQPRGAGKLERLVEPTSKRGYWQYLPKDYVAGDEASRAQRRWPVVVSFHGMKPFDNARPQALEWEQEADRYGYIVIAPELRAPDVFGQFPLRSVSNPLKGDEQATLRILDHVFANTHADPTNVLSTGWSSGGYMAHYMLNRHPDRFTCLGVRQANFSSSVLDAGIATRSRTHPIFIVNTENDFSICRAESRQAVQWYQGSGYRNVAWAVIKDKGHERTPDLAADFFSRVSDVPPSTPPKVLAGRQAIDGNPGGLALLAGRRAEPLRESPRELLRETAPARQPPPRIAAAAPAPRRVEPTPERELPQRSAMNVSRIPQSDPSVYRSTAPPLAAETRTRGSIAADPRTAYANPPVTIRVSSAIGIEPLHLGFSAECPASWHNSADFHWTINDQPVGSGIAGQKTITEPGVFKLGLLVVTSAGQEHRATRTVRVLPRLQNESVIGHSN